MTGKDWTEMGEVVIVQSHEMIAVNKSRAVSTSDIGPGCHGFHGTDKEAQGTLASHRTSPTSGNGLPFVVR